jgi:hypothetical protein
MLIDTCCVYNIFDRTKENIFDEINKNSEIVDKLCKNSFKIL